MTNGRIIAYEKPEIITIEKDFSDVNRQRIVRDRLMFDELQEVRYFDISVKEKEKERQYSIEEILYDDNSAFRSAARECRKTFGKIYRHKKCIHCNGFLKELDSQKVKENFHESNNQQIWDTSSAALMDNYYVSIEERVWVCTCGWWKREVVQKSNEYHDVWKRDPDSEHFDTITVVHGIAKQYDVSNYKTPIELIRTWLKKNPRELTNIDPYRFEEVVAHCFRDCLDYSEVIHVGGRKDRGIDILLVRTHGHGQVLVQVKRRSNININEGVDVVRQLNGVLLREGVPHGMVVTTAQGYTKDAIAEAREVSLRTGVFQKSEPDLSPSGEIQWKFFSRYNVELLSYCDVISLLELESEDSYNSWEDFSNVHLFRYPLVERNRKK